MYYKKISLLGTCWPKASTGDSGLRVSRFKAWEGFLYCVLGQDTLPSHSKFQFYLESVDKEPLCGPSVTATCKL